MKKLLDKSGAGHRQYKNGDKSEAGLSEKVFLKRNKTKTYQKPDAVTPEQVKNTFSS